MDDIKYLVGKMDKMSDDMTEVKVTLAKQEQNIAYHINRTDLLETKVDILKEEVMKNKTIKDLLVFITKISPLLAALGAGWAKIKGIF